MFLALKQSSESHKLKENLEVETIVAGWLMTKVMSYLSNEQKISFHDTKHTSLSKLNVQEISGRALHRMRVVYIRR
jgi:hypothetical protein